MTSFAIDLLSGKKFLFNTGFSGTTGTTSGATYPQVGSFSELPLPASSHVGEIYVVRVADGSYITDVNDAGLYWSNGLNWIRLGDIRKYFSSDHFQVYDSVDNTKGFDISTSNLSTGQFRTLQFPNKDGVVVFQSDLNTFTGTTLPANYYNKTQINTFTGTTLPANYHNKLEINYYTGTTALNTLLRLNQSSPQTVINGAPIFGGGLVTNSIRPTVDSVNGIHIHKADGITPIININTVSGLTGFGTISPQSIIHIYGTDNTPDAGWNLQKNGIIIDGAFDVDKDVSWFDDGELKFTSQIFRCEYGKYWYLSSPQGHVNQLTVSDTGRVGINNQTNVMDYHAILETGGPNDINVSGIYTQSYVSLYDIEINSVTGLTDTFRWRSSTDFGVTYTDWSSTSGLTLTSMILNYGVEVYFDNLTGHSLGTKWIFNGFPQIPMGTFVITPNKFAEVQTTNNYTSNPIIYTDITGSANSSKFGITHEMFKTGVTNNAIYFGTLDKLNSIYINLSTVGEGIILHTEYWNGIDWVDLNVGNHAYNDKTYNLTQTGIITWEVTSMLGWISTYMPNLTEGGYDLYWIRLVTSTSPTKAPVAISFARGGNNRLSVLTSPLDTIPSFYVDSLGRTNIGGGNITGNNVFQINTDTNYSPVTAADITLFEIDSDSVCASGIKTKISSNDSYGSVLMFVKTRGTLGVGTNIACGDTIGNIDFRARVGGAGGYIANISSQYVGNGSTRYGDLVFSTNNNSSTPSERVRIDHSGNVGFGIKTPSAIIHINSGTTTNAQMKFTSGSLLSSPQVGAFEFNNDKWYGTITTGSARKTFAFLESPTFTGNPELPVETTLNTVTLCNYIWNSGGTNNANLYKTCDFNKYTGSTQPTIDKVITGATNGICRSGCHDICLGGVLTSPLIISGTKDICFEGGRLDLASSCGAQIWDKNGCGIELLSSGGTTTIKGMTPSGLEALRFQISDSQATYTDSRILARGIEYNSDYSNTYSARSLVDKSYVDTHAGGIFPKVAVNVATTTNLTSLSGLTTIDGIALTNNMRVLVKNQNTGSQNGVYIATGTTWTRATDFDQTSEVVNGSYFLILTGNTYKNNSWILNTPNPISVGVTPLTFVIFTSANGVTSGNGISVIQTGGDYNISTKLASNSSLCVDASGLYVNNNIAGIGLDYSTGVLSVCGSALAGSSITWSGNTFNVNPSTGNLSIALGTKLNTCSFNTYSGNTASAISCRLLSSIFQTYTGTTAPAQFANHTNFDTYTGTTAPNTYVTKSAYNIYTGATKTIVDGKAFLSGATFSGILRSPKASQNDNSTCVATTSWYISQGSTSVPLMSNGTALCGTSNLFARQDHVHPSDTSRVTATLFNTYTGTTAPAQFAGINTLIVAMTGATLINATYNGKTIEANGTFTITFPNSMATGMQVDVINVGSGTITLAASTTLQSKSSRTKLATQYVGASVYHRGSNVWLAVGDLTP